MLRTHKLGEADRIVVLHDRWARQGAGRGQGCPQDQEPFRRPAGAARTGSSLLLYEGRELDVVTQAETVEHYPAAAGGPRPADRRHGHASRRSTRSTQEGEPNAAPLPDAGRRAADPGGSRRRAFASAGRRLLLEAAGLGRGGPGARRLRSLRLDRGRATIRAHLVSFDPVEGGALCREHRRGPALEPGALDLIRRILGGDLATGARTSRPAGPPRAVSDLATTARRGSPRAASAHRPPARPRIAATPPGPGGRRRCAARRTAPPRSGSDSQCGACGAVCPQAHTWPPGRDRRVASPFMPAAWTTSCRLCKQRGFVFPSAEIYGGFRSTYDYGPLGRPHAPQRQGRLVAVDGAAPPRGRRPRRRHPVQPEDLGGIRPPGQLHRPAGRLPQLQGALAGRSPGTRSGRRPPSTAPTAAART